METTLVFGGGGIAHGIAEVIPNCVIIPKAQCDVRSPGDIVNQLEKYEPANVINCAGVSFPAPMKEAFYTADEIQTNLQGSFNIAFTSISYLVQKMIFIASVAGKYGKPNHAGYSASKAGVISLVQSLGMEGYKAYSISPGRVNTEMRQRDYPNDTVGSRLEPEEIGDLVKEILDGKYSPGDNIIIRRIGLETAPIKVDKGEPWRTELKVGEPVLI